MVLFIGRAPGARGDLGRETEEEMDISRERTLNEQATLLVCSKMHADIQLQVNTLSTN